MKIPMNPNTQKPAHLSRLMILAAGLLVPATGLAQTMWTDGTADFNIPANWNGVYIDGSDNATPNPNCDNDTGSNSVILIQTGDPAWYHGDTLAGQGTNTSGAYVQTGSTNNTGYPSSGNWLRMGIGSGSYGSYVLSNGVVNVAGRTQLGENGTGYLEVDGGVYNTGYNGNPGIVVGQGDFGPGTGTLVLNGGTINNINNETWFGEAGGSGHDTGYFLMTGGTLNANSWFVFGRNDGGAGYGVMTGGTINFTGGGQFLVGGGGLGSLIQSGGTINAFNQYLVPQSGNASTDVGTNILSGTAVLNVHDWLAVGRNGGSGELDISGNASITRDNASDGGANFDVGASGHGVLNQNGGAITNLAGHTFIGENGTGFWNLNSGIASLGTVVMGQNNGSSGTLNLNGGTLQVFQIGVGTGGSEVNFNGSIVQATANNANFLTGVTETFISSGGATIDSQNFNITIGEELDDAGGGLTKIGSGTLTLSNPNNNYSGDTVVNAGALIVGTGSGANGNYVVANNAALGVALTTANGQLNQSSLTLGAGSALDFNLDSFGNPSSAALNVGGAVTVNGTVTINIADGLPQLGTFPLIQFPNGALTGPGTFVLGSIPTGLTASLIVSSTSVSLNISGINLPVWQGLAGGTWDTGADTNWINQGTGMPTVFANGDTVQFNDTAPGTTTVNLTTTVTPSSVTVNNNNLSYTINGSGSISGSTGLTKEGTNSLAILNPGGNAFTGVTVIGGGIVSVTNLANGGSSSAIGASSASPTNLVLAGGSLIYSGSAISINRGYTADNTNGAPDIITISNLTLSGSVLSAMGSGFTKSGPAQLTYAGTGSNTLSDVLGYDVAQGTVLFNSGTNSVAGSLTVGSTNGAPSVLDLNNNAALNLLSGGLFDIADSLGGPNTNYAIVNQTGGTVNVPAGYSTFIGQNSNSVGVYNLSAGVFNFNNWLAVGRDNGVGTINLSGSGALNMISGNGGNIDIGNSGGLNGQLGTGVLNQSGGSVSNVVAGTWLGEGAGAAANGTWNMTGGIAWLGYLGIGYNGTGTGQLSISGNASITVFNNPIELGRTAGGSGILTIGGTNGAGTLTMTGNSDFNVGNQGNGILNMLTGGTLTLGNQTTMYLTRGSAASGYVYLNSGSKIVTGYVNNGWGFSQGITTNASAFYFNGGTLQAATGSPYFIQPYVNAIIQTNGAFIDDGGFGVTVLCTFVDAAGSTAGLTKSGSGTLILAATNAYTGPTVVTAGTLQANVLNSPVTVDSGATLLNANIINGSVTVNSGGTLGGNVGTIGTVTVNGSLSLAAGSTTYLQITPSSNDQIAGLTGVTYAGSLIVSNISASPLTSGSKFKLFNSAAAGGGNFSTVTIQPVGTGTFNPATGILTITSSGAIRFNPTSASNGNLILTGTGGSAGGTYSLLTATNLLTPLVNWTTNTTGVFGTGGTFSNGVPIGAKPAQFFMLKTP
ncbi:MAG TPA: autotransporter-associated beta strand repeat-containing protein [Verrucomicrobiae bacterium]|jgi:autotransporter-associated beta strand protein|nr:autotransporter-associated beta strand repeat-containing protein [Verrucomicrobiae bacterium]